MEIGVPKEIKIHEQRVGIIPSVVKELVAAGHVVHVETKAGLGVGVDDADYERAGARILMTAEEVFKKSTLIVKVKEPQPQEWALLTEDHILFTYLHLAADMEQTRGLMASGCAAIAYETVTDPSGRLPLLAPMSTVAGCMSVQVGARALEGAQNGAGLLLSGIPGVAPGKVVVLGAGVAGKNAVRIALGMGAHVTAIDAQIQALQYLEELYGRQGGLVTLLSTAHNIEENVVNADLVIGSVLIPGASAPKLVSEELVKAMKKRSALVDIAIDQGGCFATSKPTTHSNPYYVMHDIVHYCVTNMPGAVPKTSTIALNGVTGPFVLKLANHGLQGALAENPYFMDGLNVYKGKITNKAVAKALNLEYNDPRVLLA